jgi:hypothetical protein
MQLVDTHAVPLDLIEELRLRRWARRNYVPAEQRAGEWHPVVLDEMRAKDAEMPSRRIGARYAPLPPTQVNITHDRHEAPPEPKLTRIDSPAVEWSLS